MEDEPIELLVSRRSKRSTAGNRMQAALAEMAAVEDLTADVAEDDNDFTIEKDEQDVFESDFESTDEEDASKDNEDAAEKLVYEEERRQRKSARSKLDKTTAAAHARNKATFNPQTRASSKPAPKLKRARVEDPSDDAPVASTSTPTAAAAATATPAEPESSPLKRKRKSLRVHTVLNTSATVKRLKESEHHKALAPKKTKSEAKKFTQADLIKQALDNEEGNIRDHRDYLKNEEAKRKQARVVRATVKGPALRWVSKVEEVKVVVPPPPPPPPPPVVQPPPPVQHPQPLYSYNAAVGYPVMQTYTPYSQHSPYAQVQPYNSAFIAFSSWPPEPLTYSNTAGVGPSYAIQRTMNMAPAANGGQITMTPPATGPTQTTTIPQTGAATPTNSTTAAPVTTTTPTTQPAPSPAPEAEPEIRIEKVGKNYLIHHLARSKDVKKPTWNDSMEAMFGNHVRWDQLKVYTTKNRPLARPKQTCMITGKTGIYKDPRTGVPFADVGAYRVLTGLLKHDYVWSPVLGCYVGKDVKEGEVRERGEGGASGSGSGAVAEEEEEEEGEEEEEEA